MKIKMNDQVLVIAGKDRGKTGKIIRINSKLNKVTVEKIAVRTKHIKKKQGQSGQIIHFEAPINASNIMIICPSCSKKTRVAHVKLENNKKQRVCKKCKQSLDQTVHSKKTAKK